MNQPLENQCRIIALANQKGGVGKTTTSVNLATALAAVDQRVLLLDLDPQGNASTGLGIPPKDRNQGSYQLLFDAPDAQSLARPTILPNLSIITASQDLAGAEIELVSMPQREFRLRTVLSDLRKNYDYILIDCPPSLNLLTLNALVAADAVLVPLQCEFYALEGVSHLIRTLDRVRAAFNPELALDGVVLTMYDRRNALTETVEKDVRGYFNDKVYTTVIPRNVRVSEAPSHGKPVILYDHRSAGARAYLQLAGEMLRRHRQSSQKASPKSEAQDTKTESASNKASAA